jgi:hypothetical protein
MHTIIEDFTGEVLMHLDYVLPHAQQGTILGVDRDGPALAIEDVRLDLTRYPHAMVVTVRDTPQPYAHKFDASWRTRS